MVSLFCVIYYFYPLPLGNEEINLTHSGHGDHQEIDTVPVRQALAVAEIRRVAGILKLKVEIPLNIFICHYCWH